MRYWLAAVVLLLAFLVLIGIPWALATIITGARNRARHRSPKRTPDILGLTYRPIEFAAADGVVLRGWFLPAERSPRGVIIYCNPLGGCRDFMLDMAHFGYTLNYDGIVFDFRSTGESDGEVGTLGYRERLDVQAAVAYALAQQERPDRIVLWGISMGAAAALMASAETPEITSVIADSPFLSFRQAITHRIRVSFHLPSFPVAAIVVRWSSRRGRFRPDDFDLRVAVTQLGWRPILFIANAADLFVPLTDAQTLRSHAKSPLARLVIVSGKAHGLAFIDAPDEYRAAVREFLT